MASIASKNLYELLGNDPEQDPERREPEPPTKAIDKPTARHGKRNAAPEAPGRGPARGPRQDSYSGDQAREPDRPQNRNRNDNYRQDRHPNQFREGAGRGRGRGYGRGRGGRMSDDRHSKTGIGEHEKQTAHGWGGQSGTEELADEKAGEAIAKAEESQGVDELPSGANLEGQDWGAPAEGADAAAEAEAAAAEAEEKTKSYAAYLAEQAEKKLSLGLTTPEARKANEGSSSKFPEGKALHPRGGDDEEGDVYFSGQGGKAKRERARKEKTLVELDDARLRDQPREGGFRGGRGGRRGSEGGGYRGEGRGRGGRGRGEGGPPRGAGGPPRGAGGPPRGAGPRGGRGGQSGPNVSDTNAFPSLGA